MISFFILRAIFYKSHIWSKKKVIWYKNGDFFRNLHKILSDNMVSVYVFGPHFDPIGVGVVDDLADFTKTDLKTLFLRVIHRE
jgi:hypothetical protein